MTEDVLGDGRLIKRLVVAGDGPRPAPGKRVWVNYETILIPSGVKVDSSWDRNEPFDFILGEGDVLEAWDLAVSTMKPGETSEFSADPSLAYGEDGAGDDIPASATLKFTIELLAGPRERLQVAAKTDKPIVSEEAKMQRAEEARERGNAFTRGGDFAKALEAYREALGILRGLQGTDVEILRTRNSLRLSCLLNSAHCDIKLGEFAAAVKSATEALEIDPKSCKAMYRRGIAHLLSGSLQESRADLLEAARLDPHNVEIRGRLEECKEKLRQSEQWERSTFGGMFGKAPEQCIVARNVANLPQVWLDVQIGDTQVERVHIALYSDTVPRTAENFRALCTGERGVGSCGQPLHFRQTLVHRVVPRNLMEAGDIENYDGSGGESIYGRTFPDEAFVDTHHKRGLLSMANKGPGTNNSKFIITLRSLPHLDGRHVVFGEVVGECNVLQRISDLEIKYPDRPVQQVAIVDSGEIGSGDA